MKARIIMKMPIISALPIAKAITSVTGSPMPCFVQTTPVQPKPVKNAVTPRTEKIPIPESWLLTSGTSAPCSMPKTTDMMTWKKRATSETIAIP